MDLPITRPSMMSYADQLDFNELLGKSRSDRFNGFIRVTSGSLEGHILFKEGNQVAASFDRYSKIEAIEKIRSIINDANVVIEVFDLKATQLDYLMNINKPYLINLDSKADTIRDEITRSEPPETKVETETFKIEEEPEIEPEEVLTPISPPESVVDEPEPEITETKEEPEKPEIESPAPIEEEIDITPEEPETEVSKDVVREEPIKADVIEDANVEEPVTAENKYYSPPEGENPEIEADITEETGTDEPIDTKNKYYNPPEDDETIPSKDTVKEEPKIGLVEEPAATETKAVPNDKSEIKDLEDTLTKEKPLAEDIKFKEPDDDTENMDRTEIMKKYGLKDVHEEEVETLLESYKGGSLSAEDVEKVELTLMNKIKKSVLGIPKIKGAEVIVFLDNSSQLLGTINIISEYESKGLLSRIMGDSKDIDNLKIQIINLTQIEIRKSFRGYPEIVDNFEINVEFS